jgi:hypothetical protein
LRRFLDQSAFGALVALSITAATGLVAGLVSGFSVVGTVGSGGLLLVVVLSLVVAAAIAAASVYQTPPTLQEIALKWDADARTHDRFATLLQFTERGGATPLQKLAVQECHTYLLGLNERDWIVLRPPPFLRWCAFPLVALIAIATISLVLSESRDASRQRAIAAVDSTLENLDKLAQTLDQRSAADQKEAMARLAEELRKAAERIREEAEDVEAAKRAAARELSRLEALTEALRSPTNEATPAELAALGKAVEPLESAKALAEALQQGDLTRAGEAAGALRTNDPEQAAQAEERLKAAVEHLAKQGKNSSAAMKNLAQNSSSAGNDAGLLKELSDLLNEMAQKRGASRQNGNRGNRKGQGQGNAEGKPMTDSELKQLLSALRQLKDQGDEGNSPQESDDSGDGGDGESAVRMLSFGPTGKGDKEDPETKGTPSGLPGGERDSGTTKTPFGTEAINPAETARMSRIKGRLGEGESLSTFFPATGRDAPASTQRMRELYDAAVGAAEEAVVTDDIPVGSRMLIRRYFENIRPR